MTTLFENLKKQIEISIADKKMASIIFDIFFHHIEDMMFVMTIEEGPTFRYLFVNESAYKKMGFPADFIGKNFFEVLPEEHANILHQNYCTALKNDHPTQYRDQIEYSDGTAGFGETILTPVKDHNGVVSLVIGVTRDITETIHEQEKIVESKQIYRSLMDQNMDGILSLDQNGDILECNPSVFSITGFSHQDLTTQSFLDYILEDNKLTIRHIIDQALQGHLMESKDCHFIHRRGYAVHVHIKAVPIVVNDKIKGVYVIMRDTSEQLKYSERINYMVFHDQLTGLLNRTTLVKGLNESIQVAHKQGSELSLIYIDLDRFKLLNDSLGHHSGDLLLKKVGQRLLSIRKDPHSVYRQGGDEFVIILEDATRTNTVRFINEIYEAFKLPFLIEGEQYYVSPSIGVSMFPHDGDSAQMLMQKADSALFHVKNRGRAHYLFYSSNMEDPEMPNPFIMDSSLRKAIENHELMLFYQPQIDLETNEVTSFEALLRWNNSTLGLVSPASFIPLAEDSGLIIPIGDWVIEEVCKQLNDWNQKGYRTKIAVNLSPKQFQQPNLLEVIQTNMEKYHVDPAWLDIEITEGTMQNMVETNKKLHELKGLGLTISVDDFGTGYSSLSYLKQFPLNVLKIDRSFIKEIMTDNKDAAITKTIIHLGHSLGLEIIAEGVETIEQLEFLKSIDCEKAQGYYFSRAIPAYEAERRFLYKKKVV